MFVLGGSNVMNDSWVAAYQELLELEKRKVDDIGLGEPPDSASFLSDDEVKSVCQRHRIEFQRFISSDLMVQYSGLGWRTMHFDLIYRIVHIRNLEKQAPIPLEYKIEIQSEPVPDFNRHKFSEVLSELIPNKSAQETILLTFSKSKYEGLSSHQLPIVEELLSKKPRYRTAAIVAPTASGKTLAFFLPVIVKAVERNIEGKAGVSSILVYPRKALERDQLQFFLTIVDSVNRGKGHHVTIGIDDGDTKRFNEIRHRDTYREIRCIECSNTLLIEKKENATTVKCSKCSKEYPYLLASKDEIWQKKPTILITNLHTIYRRLLAPATVKMFAGIDYLVFDEAHVYTDYLGGHAFHIIKLLRHAARSNGSNPYFVFSSATIPNPRDFIARLAGCETDEIFYVDYRKTLEKAQGTGRRLMLYLYLLPHPDSSVETLTEALVLAVTLWCHRHNLKAITFVDSVAEISTLSDYVHTTILDKRQGREVTDHLYSTSNISENSYNWFSLVPLSTAEDLDTFRRFVLNQYKASIDIHYGQLPLSQRARVEYDFSQGLLKLLLSTSTLELGIDLSDVAAIIQHKLPITPEGVVQRVGRSGRSSTCLRVALGIIALQSSPLSTLYMFDERLRGRLADPSLLPPARVGEASASIKLQHILSLLLYKRALEGRPTFVAGEEYLRSKQAVVNAVKEIVSELNEELLAFNAKVGLFDDGNIVRSQTIELKSLLSAVVDTTKDTDQGDFPQVKEKWEGILVNVEDKANTIRQTLQQIEGLRTMFEKIQGLDGKVLSELESLRNLLRRAYDLSSALLSTARSSYRAGDEGAIQRWYKANSSGVEKVAKEMPDSDEALERLYKPLLTYFSTTMGGDYKVFRAKFGFGFDEVSKALTAVTTSLGSPTEKGLVSFIRELPNEAKFLQSVYLPGLTTYESLRRIESELKVKYQGIDIFDAINMLLFNRTRFSLMLEPPSPELQLAGVEEA
jgi:superfamily II DNA/RNA helicase/ribosomal protein S27E